MNSFRIHELLYEHLYGWNDEEMVIHIDQLTLERILEQCKANGLRPVLGLFVKPGTSGGDAWRCSITLPDEGIVVGTSDTSAWEATVEAILRYYGAWEETE